MRISSTKISDFRDCRRKFWLRYIAKVPFERHPSAKRGSAIHDLMEQWGKTGHLDKSSEYWIYADKLINLSRELFGKRADVPSMVASDIEKYIKLKISGWPVVTGKIDRVILPAVSTFDVDPWSYLGQDIPDDWYLEVIDYKTTSNLKYAKTETILENDPQRIIYSASQASRWPFVRFHLLYVRVSGTITTHHVKVNCQYQELKDKVSSIYNLDIRPMIEVASQTRPDDVPFNPDVCDKYGGCPFIGICNRIGGIDPFSRLFT